MELSIMTIGAFVSILNQATKYFGYGFLKKDVSAIIPFMSIVYGVILGIVGYYIPGSEIGTTLVDAIFVGMASGSASTGVHQIGKQITKNKTTTPEVEIKEDIEPTETSTKEEEPIEKKETRPMTLEDILDDVK